MNTSAIVGTLTTLLSEVVDGAPATGAYLLNRGDAGLLRSLDLLDAAKASTNAQGGASIAAHVDHLRYGLSLMNRWAAGEDPFRDADWNASWRTTAVTEDEWKALRTSLGVESHRWLDVVREPREVDPEALNAIVGSIVHLAYHLGAIRQIDRALRGPRAEDQT